MYFRCLAVCRSQDTEKAFFPISFLWLVKTREERTQWFYFFPLFVSQENNWYHTNQRKLNANMFKSSRTRPAASTRELLSMCASVINGYYLLSIVSNSMVQIWWMNYLPFWKTVKILINLTKSIRNINDYNTWSYRNRLTKFTENNYIILHITIFCSPPYMIYTSYSLYELFILFWPFY